MGDQAFGKWNKLGPRTKALLAGSAKRAQEIDDFFMLGKMMKFEANPSGTAKTRALVGMFSGAMTSVGIMWLNPAAGAVGLVTDVALVPITANQLAKVLYSPGGARLLTRAAKTPPTASAAKYLASRIVLRLVGDHAASTANKAQLPASRSRSRDMNPGRARRFAGTQRPAQQSSLPPLPELRSPMEER